MFLVFFLSFCFCTEPINVKKQLENANKSIIEKLNQIQIEFKSKCWIKIENIMKDEIKKEKKEYHASLIMYNLLEKESNIEKVIDSREADLKSCLYVLNSHNYMLCNQELNMFNYVLSKTALWGKFKKTAIKRNLLDEFFFALRDEPVFNSILKVLIDIKNQQIDRLKLLKKQIVKVETEPNQANELMLQQIPILRPENENNMRAQSSTYQKMETVGDDDHNTLSNPENSEAIKVLSSEDIQTGDASEDGETAFDHMKSECSEVRTFSYKTQRCFKAEVHEQERTGKNEKQVVLQKLVSRDDE